ncbi:MAG TPA: nuclear transport factor 2 family protein [Vicinamibacterales bacterium]|nr:nuclear transport factor 2 family protein [Vicinamibacterales bacterium]
MRLKGLLAVVVLISVAGVAVVAQNRSADEATLRRLIDQTAAAIRAHDVDGVMALYSKEVLVSYPGVPDTTYDVFYSSYRQMMNPSIETDAVPSVEEVIVSGDLAIIRMLWNTTITEKATGRKSSRQAKDLQVWRRENGSWKFFRGMWHHTRKDGPP